MKGKRDEVGAAEGKETATRIHCIKKKLFWPKGIKETGKMENSFVLFNMNIDFYYFFYLNWCLVMPAILLKHKAKQTKELI